MFELWRNNGNKDAFYNKVVFLMRWFESTENKIVRDVKLVCVK